MMKKGTRFLNQLKWDLRYVWWAFAALLVLAPFCVGIEVQEFRSELATSELSMLRISNLVWGMMMLVAGSGVALVIQKDVPFGGLEFWRSRPVGRATMFGSKISVSVLLVVLLALTSLGAPLLTGAAGEWSLFLKSFFVCSVGFLILAGGLAAVSSSLMRMLYLGLLLGGGFFLFYLLIEERLLEREFQLAIDRFKDGFSRIEYASLWLAVGGVVVVAWQYWTRMNRVGVGLLFAVLVGGLSVFCFLPADEARGWMLRETSKKRGLKNELEKLALNCQLLEEQDLVGLLRRSPSHGVEEASESRLRLQAEVDGVPKGYRVTGVVILGGQIESQGQLLWPRSNISKKHVWHSLNFRGSEKFQGFKDLTGREREERSLSAVIFAKLPNEELERWSEKQLSYQGKGWVHLSKEIEVARFSYGERTEFEELGARVSVSFNRSFAGYPELEVKTSCWTPFPFEVAAYARNLRFFVVNEKRGEFFEVYSNGARVRERGPRMAYQEVKYRPPSGGQFVTQVSDQKEWLEEAEVLAIVEAGRIMVSVPMALEGFELGDVIAPRSVRRRRESEGNLFED